ncbi:16S rRNA (cytosine(967)-C(5))-methyltransferase RsmB [Sporanaerobacter acetigenes]|uniref:16S rRNA (cytosine(967)-C(5))-methyltransferase n=1 Tax=Sporanaerobacter acetigenes DSM 13106 TaxID=1123281 RepID=A0A1M5XXK8_9FIRM|nr:16S rRNA (cytosine(967)-C(5))-methyltransferase RsmB [Sporanaerobacter acetigenes]SHI04288.1 NusB antitermination factor [Sporanaerobacter acetigenes DSM 13106]
MTKNAREVALNILIEIDEKGAYSNIVLNKIGREKLSKLDENFVRELVYGVLENRLYLDWVIKKFSKIKLKKIEPIILEILRMGVYQIVLMDKIPDSAAVNESVKLAKKYSHIGSAKYVNGLLRNVSRNKDSIREIDLEDKKEYLRIKYSHPEWMINRWLEEFGEEFTEDLCRANNTRPKLNIRINTLKIKREQLKYILESKGYIVSNTNYASDGLIIENPQGIIDIEEFKAGFFIIQDESSMLVSQILDPKEGSLVLDLCSAPGGKTTHIAQKMNNHGKILARDIYEHKLKLVQENSNRLGIDIIKTEKFDSIELDENLIEKVDYALIDAPCTGLGMIRRRPEIKWNRTENDIVNMSDIQYKILKNASKYLKSGGTLVYSTCSIEREENIDIINKFISENEDFKLVSVDNLLDSKENVSTAKDGYIELFPHIHGTDGFFVAKLLKNYR